MEKQTTPTERLIEASTRFDTEDERKAFIEGANYILNQFEHWAKGLWSVQGGGPGDIFPYGCSVARDILDDKIKKFRK